jgi:hypothetical protein
MDIINYSNYDSIDLSTISNNGITITLKEIEEVILETAQDFYIDDLRKCPTTTFKGVLRVTGQRLFRHSKILINFRPENDDGSINLLNSRLNFNINILNNQCYYIYNYICEKYNKIKSLEGFILLYSIDDEGLNILNSNPVFLNLCEKLQTTRNNSLKDKLIDSKNVVGTLAVFNDENNRTISGDNRRPDNTALLDAINQNKIEISSNI